MQYVVRINLTTDEPVIVDNLVEALHLIVPVMTNSAVDISSKEIS